MHKFFICDDDDDDDDIHDYVIIMVWKLLELEERSHSHKSTYMNTAHTYIYSAKINNNEFRFFITSMSTVCRWYTIIYDFDEASYIHTYTYDEEKVTHSKQLER